MIKLSEFIGKLRSTAACPVFRLSPTDMRQRKGFITLEWSGASIFSIPVAANFPLPWPPPPSIPFYTSLIFSSPPPSLPSLSLLTSSSPPMKGGSGTSSRNKFSNWQGRRCILMQCQRLIYMRSTSSSETCQNQVDLEFTDSLIKLI